jgi:hypothetical protein
MKKISKNRLTRLALGITAVAIAFGVTGCGETPGGRTLNAVTGDFEAAYLRVNDTNAVCFTENADSSSYTGTVCDFSGITIPNGVEVIVLTNNEPHNDKWKLNHFVDLKNKTSDCLYFRDRMISCNFLSDAANGSFGVEK